MQHHRISSAGGFRHWTLAVSIVMGLAYGGGVVAEANANAWFASDASPEPSQSVSDDPFEGVLFRPGDEDSFVGMSLEQLMAVRVTSVAGVERDWFSTPSALYVLDRVDLRRTGHQNWADAFRLVPGMNVAQINASTWAVSSRGFTGRFANRLLVLVDGRPVYDPIFGGVHWSAQPFLFEDVDRIEVVRGPGATLWGANAVNGVINVTTVDARESQGLYLTGGAGSLYRGFGAARYGGSIDDQTYYRVWASFRDNDNFRDVAGGTFPDAWNTLTGGFRLDRFGENSQITLDVGGYSNRVGERLLLPEPGGFFLMRSVTEPGDVAGVHVLGRVSQSYENGARWELQAFFDRMSGTSFSDMSMSRNSFDIDFRHYLAEIRRHELVWGLKYRLNTSEYEGHDIVSTDPHSYTDHTVSAFVQDTWTLSPDRLFVILGSKFEHNSYSGFEFQPSARLSWTPDERQTIWAAVSRPVRTPNRIDTHIDRVMGFLPFPPPNDRVVLRGNSDLRAETLLAYELGYRRKVTEKLWVDVAAFYNDYDDLIQVVASGETFGNIGSATSYGVEIASRWHVTDAWRLDAGYSMVHISATEPGVQSIGDFSPRHQAHLRSMFDITDDLEFNVAAYFTDRVPSLDVPSYVRLDVGMTWRLNSHFELAAWGQNLLESEHQEFAEPNFQDGAAAVPRSFYVQATMRF